MKRIAVACAVSDIQLLRWGQYKNYITNYAFSILSPNTSGMYYGCCEEVITIFFLL